MICKNCEAEFKQRFGREQCCSKKCAALVREAKKRTERDNPKEPLINSFLFRKSAH
jgi:hypothetical protein